jgi:hypothetical protein
MQKSVSRRKIFSSSEYPKIAVKTAISATLIVAAPIIIGGKSAAQNYIKSSKNLDISTQESSELYKI